MDPNQNLNTDIVTDSTPSVSQAPNNLMSAPTFPAISQMTPKPKGHKKLWLTVILILVLLVIGGSIYYFLIFNQKKDLTAEQMEKVFSLLKEHRKPVSEEVQTKIFTELKERNNISSLTDEQKMLIFNKLKENK